MEFSIRAESIQGDRSDVVFWPGTPVRGPRRHGRYLGSCGHAGGEVVSTLLTRRRACPSWVLAVPAIRVITLRTHKEGPRSESEARSRTAEGWIIA